MRTLYMDDSYQREFDATVKSVKDGKYVVLSDTAFYPNSGGQPYDTGTLTTDDGTAYNVVFVGKFSGTVSHEVDKEGLKEGDKVHGRIDWDKRYRLMRSHTASHIISALLHDDVGAKITGNQLTEEKIRIDFNLESFDRDLLQSAIDKANRIIAEDVPVTVSYKPRDEALKDPSMVKLASGVPEGIEELRIVTIGDPENPVDRQADGGTHVKSTGEIGRIELVKADNKGKNNRRVYVRLAD